MSTIHYGPHGLIPFLALIVHGHVAAGLSLRTAVYAQDASDLRRWFAGSGTEKLTTAYQRANARAYNVRYAHLIAAGEPKARVYPITDANLLTVAKMVLDSATDWRAICRSACLLRYNLDDCATMAAIQFCSDVSDAAIQYLTGDR